MTVAIIDALTLKPGGLLTEGTKGSDKVNEIPTFQCCHCNRTVVCNPLRQRPRHTCRKCMGLTCDTPACQLECDPVMKKIDEGRPLLAVTKEEGERAKQLWLPGRGE
jgi:hypothetical protein